MLAHVVDWFAGEPANCQLAIDAALERLEVEPYPSDAIELEEPNFYAITRAGYDISYEWTETEIRVWDIVPS